MVTWSRGGLVSQSNPFYHVVTPTIIWENTLLFGTFLSWEFTLLSDILLLLNPSGAPPNGSLLGGHRGSQRGEINLTGDISQHFQWKLHTGEILAHASIGSQNCYKSKYLSNV